MTVTASEHDQHNEAQIGYFTTRPVPRMLPASAPSTYTQRHVDSVVSALELGTDDAILDIGCGPGKYTIALAARGLNVEGVDLTPSLIEQLRNAAPALPSSVGDICQPSAELLGRFDAVVGFMMLHHVDDLAGCFTGIRKVLAKKGRVAILEPNPWFPGYYAQIAFTPGMTWRGDGGIVNMRMDVLARHASDAGFNGFKVERFGVFPPALVNRPVGQRLERLIEAVPGWRRFRAFQIFTMHT
jgi:SAM-dependent methyltransferase